MSDEATADTEIRSRLEQLVPGIDVDEAWAVMARRLEQDRHRRPVRVLAVAAAIVVVLVVAGVAVIARGSTDPDVTLDVADVPTTPSVDVVPTDPAPSAPEVEQPLGASCGDRYTFENYVSDALIVSDIATWRFGPEAVTTDDGLDAETVRASHATGTGGTFYDGYHALSLSVCPGARPLPPGDGLRPEDPTRTETEAIELLASHRDGGNPNARLPTGAGLGAPPLPVTITEQTAKLVRQDEVPVDQGAWSTPPGFSAWFVRVGFRTQDGVERFAVFSFAPSGSGRTFKQHYWPFVGPEIPDLAPAGSEWVAWFDALADHAS